MITAAALQAHWWSPRGAPKPWWAWPLIAASLFYQCASGLHRATTLPRGAGPANTRAKVPTVVVGNWVVGGAGKTPTTLVLIAHLRQAGWNPGVISRGYGRAGEAPCIVQVARHTAQEVGDEPLLIARSGQVPVAVGRDRVAARQLLLDDHPEVDLVIADDGLQHHRLHRDLAVVVVDERGAGNGWCLPAGPLREPIPSRLDSRTLIVYSGGTPTLPLPGHVAQRQLTGVQTLEDWAAGHAIPADGGWSLLQGVEVQAAAGIAVPNRFFQLLKAQGLKLGATHALPDHDPWDHDPWSPHTADVIVTEKDAVKLVRRANRAGFANASDSTRVWVARLDLALPAACLAEVDRVLHGLAGTRNRVP